MNEGWEDGALRAALRSLVSFVIRFGGIHLLVRATLARDKVAILVYHDPAPDVLGAHLAYLERRYSFVSLDALVDALHARAWSTLPSKGIVVTFDDGHKGNAALLPVFRRHGLVPTIFVCTQIVGTTRHFWFLDAPEPEPLKPLPHEERLAALERSLGFSARREYGEDDRQALSLEEIERLRDTVDFGSHTRFHPLLPTCSDVECEFEIRDSRVEVEQLSGRPCAHFAFPNGAFSDRELRLVQEAGYASGRTGMFGWNGSAADPFLLRVIPVRDDASVTRLAADLTTIPARVARLRQRFEQQCG